MRGEVRICKHLIRIFTELLKKAALIVFLVVEPGELLQGKINVVAMFGDIWLQIQRPGFDSQIF
jgi:hypothetical protein